MDDSIDKIIKEADIQEIANGQTGNCLSVAVALREKFGGEVKIVTEIPGGEGFNHAVLEKDSKLYDSYGRRLFVDVFEMHIPKEVKVEDINNHIYSLEEPEKEFSSLYNKDLKNKIKKRLERAKNLDS